MASISEPLLGAGAAAKNDWAKAEAATSLTFTGEGQIRRGIDVEIGLSALANADAGLSRFVDATVRGNAFAEATASLRLQLPLNLFDQFGLALGAQAVAQAAAGIEVGLGLSIGDFINLLSNNDEALGLPLDLVVLLLDEAVVGGKFEAHIAAAAMAYASILITGEVVKNPGFQISAEAGLGLAAGVGFSGGLDIGIRNFRRFYGRAVDRAVGAVVDGIGELMPDELKPLQPRVKALAPMATTALRLAYEIGDYLANVQPGHDHQSALDLSNHCVGIILEEAQRFICGQFLQAGLRSLERLVTHDVPNFAEGLWDKLMPQRQALANVLYATPDEPFQPTAENAAYWSDLIGKGTDLIAQLPPAPGADLTRGAAIIFSATELLTDAIRSRINVAQGYAFAIGAGRTTSPQPIFSGPLQNQPGPRIREHINTVLTRNKSHSIDYPDLVAYLATDVIIAALRDLVPSIDEYLSIFRNPKVADDLRAILRTLLQNREAFIRNSGGDFDPQATLGVLLNVIDAFVTAKIEQELVPAINRQISDGNIKLYFNEVLVGTLLYIKEVAFETVLEWETTSVDRKAFTEALSSVMTMLIGRSLVLVADGFMAVLQTNMQAACAYAASRLDAQKGPFEAIGVAVSPELKALLADTLRIGGEIFGPLPEDTRQRLRSVLYDVMEALPPTQAERASFLTNLADQFFIPNEDSVRALSDQLLAISRQRFQLFVERVLETGGTLLANAIEDIIKQVVETVLHWATELEQSIGSLLNDVRQLGQLIQAAMAQAQQAFAKAIQQLKLLVDQFSNQNFRATIREALTNEFLQIGKGVLAGNPLYRSLPREARNLVTSILHDVIHDLVDAPILNPLLDSIGAVAGDLDSMLDDIRELNPNQSLGPQLLDLLIDRMEDRIRDTFGSNPRISVGFYVSLFGFSQHFSLGTLELPFATVFTLLRNVINAAEFYNAALEQAAADLGAAFSKSLDLTTKQALQSQRTADLNRLNRIRGEFTSDPKTITILNPVQSLVYDDDVTVQIRLGNVPSSYLGLNKDEQQRVLIFLNGTSDSAAGTGAGQSIPRPRL